MARRIEGTIYKLTYTALWHDFVECSSKEELFRYVAQEIANGKIVTAVNEMCKDGRTPKVKLLTDKEFKRILHTNNTRIDYLYRDASYYKVHQHCVIQGPITPEQIQLILDSCEDGEYFIPSKVHPWMPEQRFDGYDPDVDHDFFEIGKCSFSSTQEEATIPITADELVRRFQAAYI